MWDCGDGVLPLSLEMIYPSCHPMLIHFDPLPLLCIQEYFSLLYDLINVNAINFYSLKPSLGPLEMLLLKSPKSDVRDLESLWR